jgi:PadR family transcriptional regulator, regulatory protein PadR
MLPTPRGYHLTATQVCLAREFVSCPDNWQYGYELVRRTGTDSGTVYPILNRMRDRGWLEKQHATYSGSGPLRYLYRLTPEGSTILAEMVRRWDARHGGHS